ncbi:MAG: esterase family protein [Lentisphaeria bacterium]|nr:esterase family protein [Lentisphaeria bacterium]
MAFFECNFFSETLGIAVSVNVVLPQQTFTQIGMQNVSSGKEFPVLYLLHGLSDDHTIWMRRTSIERYAATYGIAVVMPCGGRSYYTDMAHGGKYWTYISEELPARMKEFFKISSKREDTFAAGLSMGGYGALKLALRCPDRFAAAASLSGALDPLFLLKFMPKNEPEFCNIFGDLSKFHGSENDLWAECNRRKKENAAIPELFLSCGTEDALYQDTVRFREHLDSFGIPHAGKDYPGSHSWEYWDTLIKEVLAWLPIRKKS